MTKVPGKLNILNVGDVHLGHARTPTEYILRNLDLYISVPSVLDKIDLVTIAGDFFDRCLSYADYQVGLIESWITRFLMQCATANVIVRVLEGTPSHDWKQSAFFEQQAKSVGIPVDVKHVTELSIEHIDALDLDILYVPDKWRPTTVETWTEVQGLLSQHGLKKVDIALMHGAFEYQLPEIVTEPAHDSTLYLGIVNYLIFIGHVHRSFVRDRIVPSGSFDRLVQGEEEPKGFHLACIDTATGNYELTFKENKKAKIYKAVDLNQFDETNVWDFLNELVASYPKKSSFSLRVRKGNTLNGALRQIRSTYPDYEWDMSIEKSKKEKTEEMESALFADMVALPELNPEEIVRVSKAIMESKQLDTPLIEAALSKLEEIINAT